MSKKVKKRKKKQGASRTRTHRKHTHRPQRPRSVQGLTKKTGDLYHIHSQSGLNSLLCSGKPTLVDFWAPWCAPCLRMGPIFAKVAARYGNRINFAKVDTQALPQVGSRFGLRSIPTMIAFSGRKEAKREVGLMNERRMILFAESFLPEDKNQEIDSTTEDLPAGDEMNISPVGDIVEDTATEEIQASKEASRLETNAEPKAPSAGLVGRIKRLFSRKKNQSSP